MDRRMLRNFFLYFCLLIASLVQINAQRNDFRSWINFELEGELFNLIDFSIIPEVRLWDNSTRFEGFLTEVDASVPLTKFFRLGTEYRYQIDRDRVYNLDIINRFGIYAELDHRIGDLRMAYRAMYLQEYTNIYTRELGLIPESIHRHKVTLRYRNKKWHLAPGISAEWFFTLAPSWVNYQEKLRLTAGVQYRLTNKINLGIDYKYQQEFYENNPLSSHIFCVGAEYRL